MRLKACFRFERHREIISCYKVAFYLVIPVLEKKTPSNCTLYASFICITKIFAKF